MTPPHMESITVKYKKLCSNATTPGYRTPGAAAFDFALVENMTIPPRSFAKARTGLVIIVPSGYFLLVTSRSSNPSKKGIDLANSIGIIDTDYCGPSDEVFIMIENITDAPVQLMAGDRVAQGVILPIPRVNLEEVTDDIGGPSRGGFGTTGV